MLNDAALQQNGGGMAGADASDSEKLSVIVSYCRQLAALDDNDTPLEEIAASAKMFCSDLKERNPGGCDGCPQRDKIETPSWLWSLWCRSQRPYPNMPASVFDRAADNWTPLFAIADVIGGVWSTRVRDAAAAVGAGQNESRKVELLRDFRDIFNELDARPGHRLPQTLSLTGKLQDIPLADYGTPTVSCPRKSSPCSLRKRTAPGGPGTGERKSLNYRLQRCLRTLR